MSNSFSSDPYAAHSRILLAKHYEKHSQGIVVPPLKQLLEQTQQYRLSPLNTKVCIIGAGMAGLYTAMILDSLGLSYDIYEASGRCGGRLFTYQFRNGKPDDYYDVGAMRFPDTPFMKRTFELARTKLPVEVTLIPYIMSCDSSLMYFNACRFFTIPAVSSQFLQPGQPDNFLLNATTQPETGILSAPRSLFINSDITDATKSLFEQYDQYTMRTYIAANAGSATITAADINYIEMLDKSTGWYDHAFTETVLESLAFWWPGAQPYPYYCFEGGSSTLPETMTRTLQQPPRTYTAVLGITPNKTAGVDVNCAGPGGNATTTYSAVISTVTLPCLNMMDLSNCGLAGVNFEQWSAIRQARYGPAIKIGLRFTNPWWETKVPTGKIVGGQSFTDLPIRTIVYPSYPSGTEPKSSTLIVSYCWTEDAQRIGAWINADGTADPRLITTVLGHLALVHGYDPTSDYSHDYFAWNWANNPYSMGAYAFFGPEEFDSIYADLCQPATNGQLFIAGEATSACHAWVAGALDSAWRAVHQLLTVNNMLLERTKFISLWGDSEYWGDSVLAPGETPGISKLMENHLRLALACSRAA